MLHLDICNSSKIMDWKKTEETFFKFDKIQIRITLSYVFCNIWINGGTFLCQAWVWAAHRAALGSWGCVRGSWFLGCWVLCADRCYACCSQWTHRHRFYASLLTNFRLTIWTVTPQTRDYLYGIVGYAVHPLLSTHLPFLKKRNITHICFLLPCHQPEKSVEHTKPASEKYLVQKHLSNNQWILLHTFTNKNPSLFFLFFF